MNNVHTDNCNVPEDCKVTNLQIIAIYVSDIERSKKFYMRILGFSEPQEMGTGILLKSNEISVYIEGGRSPAESAGLTHPTISPVFDCPSVKKTFEFLKSQKVTIIEDYIEYSSDFAMFRFVDPDGNVLEFAGRP